MRQFLLLMRELSAIALVETWHGESAYQRKIDQFTFVNEPEPRSGGLFYHLGQLARQLVVLWQFLRFRPDVVVLTGKQEYWWVLAPLRLTKAKLVASFHGLIWRQFGGLRAHEKLLLWLNQNLILKHLDCAVSTSQVISDQFAKSAGSNAGRIPLFAHLPSYDERQFAEIAHANPDAQPFQVMFTGRVERDKGAFDLLEIARQLKTERPGEFEFHICGDGSQLDSVRRDVVASGLENAVHVHGYCKPAKLSEVMSACQAAIVPTRTECPAGFEMTCAEAILSNRPLVTSAVPPALHYVRDASIEARPDDPVSYKEAIVALKDDRDLYERKRAAAARLRGQFFDPAQSWDSAMRKAFAAVLPDRAELQALSARPYGDEETLTILGHSKAG